MRATNVDIAAAGENLPDPADLPALASADPSAALIAATAWLSSDEPATRARAHQAVGIVSRDRGESELARRHLRAALDAAIRSADRRLIVDVRATRGATLVLSGRTEVGFAELDLALRDAIGEDRAGVLMRRAFARTAVGDTDAALQDLRRALMVARRTGDRLWQAKLLHHRCHVLTRLGMIRDAERDAVAAGALFEQLGQTWMSVQAQHNLAFCAALRGDLVAALREYDAVARRYRDLGVDEPMLAVDRIAALLSAGLASEAAELAIETLGPDEDDGPARDRGPLLVAAATAELARGRTEAAEDLAKAARRAFGSAARPAWAGRAGVLAAQAQYARGGKAARLLRDATALAADPALFADDRSAARLLTARVAARRGDTVSARATLADLGRRTTGPALDRATAWLARALAAEIDGDNAGVRRACTRGLDAVDQHRAVFGAVEVRAAASVHGAEFADLGARALLRRGTARQLLAWVERSRASALADPAPVETGDTELARRLALAREAAATGASATASAKAAEQAVAALRRTSANRGAIADRQELPLHDLGDRTLVVLLVVDGTVHTVVGHHGRLRRLGHTAPLADVRREADFLRFALRRASAGIGRTSRDRLFAAGARLQDVVFGEGFSLPDGDGLVVVPPAALHDLPWSALPAMRTKELVLAPSLTMWGRAHAARRRDRRGTLLAVGPGLESGGAELAPIAALQPTATARATVLPPGDATADTLLAAMDGRRLVHLAAHGSLRADNPMFSALQVDGGPLFVHDIERLRRAPREVVLASCNSGLGAGVGSDQLLGLATALLRAGTSAVLTSTVAVSDAASVAFSVDVHRSLAKGASLPAAARAARARALDDPDPLATATALAFSVWGA